MSNTPVEITPVLAVEQHPNADRLELVRVITTQFISQKGIYQQGDLCVYFPPDVMIPETLAEELGVAAYLKHSIYPGDSFKSKCRVGAIRLRSIASFGFGLPVDKVSAARPGCYDDGADVSELVGAVKYQPPELETMRGSDTVRSPEAFHKYTSIEHYYRNAIALPEGTPVRVTEKLHGTNSRVGLIYDNGWEFMCGTHHRRVKSENARGRKSIYWKPLTDGMKALLSHLSQETNNVIVFGEIFGRKVQPMDYGAGPAEGYRVFDISVNGDYLDWHSICTFCRKFGIPVVPLLHSGPFYTGLVDEFVSGPTSVAHSENIACKFKGREGIVITPLTETYSPELCGRLILKAVSPDYYEAM